MGKFKIILVSALVGLAFASGAIYQYYCQDKPVIEKYQGFYSYTATPVNVSVEQAISWLDRAAYSHEHNLFDDDPNNDEFHQGCMDRYASIKELLLELKEDYNGTN